MVFIKCWKLHLNIVTPLAVQVARELFLDDYYKAIASGCGSCKKCKKCNPDFCNFPNETVPSMEAYGIDVFATVRNNGLEIHTLKSRKEVHNYFGLVMVEQEHRTDEFQFVFQNIPCQRIRRRGSELIHITGKRRDLPQIKILCCAN